MTVLFTGLLIILFIYIILKKNCNCITNLRFKASQFNQDLLLYYHFFQNKRSGFFIELGAYDGIKLSNTIFFEKNLDWRGILIEGGENNCKALEKNSKIRNNSVIICSAICKGKVVSYNEKGVFGKVNHSYVNKKLHKCNSISNITKYYKIRHIDLFSLDVEGSELEVLETFDFNVDVSYWMIEWNNLNRESKNQIKKILNNNGYFIKKISISPIDVIFSKIHN